MTGKTVFFRKTASESVDIILPMTTDARGLLSHEAGFSFTHEFRVVLFFMAIFAFDLGVFTLKFVSGIQAMIEIFGINSH